MNGFINRLNAAALATMSAIAPVYASPRDQVVHATTGITVAETADLPIWMERLQGRFSFEGVIHFSRLFEPDNGGPLEHMADDSINELMNGPNEVAVPVARGKADCIGLSEGSGVQCVIYVDWDEVAGQALSLRPGLWVNSELKPASILAGVTASSSRAIRFLLVDSRGIAHPGSLNLAGNSAISKLPCVNHPGMEICDQTFRIEARPDAKIIFVTLNTRGRYLRRKPPKPPQVGAPGKPERLTQWIEETLDVSFALRREPQDEQDAVPAPASSLKQARP